MNRQRLGSPRNYKATNALIMKKLKEHKRLMDELMAQGMNREEASKVAYQKMQGVK